MKTTLFLLIFLGLSTASAETFSSQDHCVAWKTEKTMALVKRVHPVGKSCTIETALEKDEPGFRFVGAFPIESFNSGDKDRDEEVLSILKAKEQPKIQFVSEFLSQKEWQDAIQAGGRKVYGQLKVGGKDFLFEPKLKITKSEQGLIFSGSIKTKFTKLSIDPPTVAGGLVAKVHDVLELHFQFQSAKITGWNEAFSE